MKKFVALAMVLCLALACSVASAQTYKVGVSI